MSQPELLNLKGLVHWLGVEKCTISKWTRMGCGPPRILIGRRYYYSRAAVREWLNSLQAS